MVFSGMDKKPELIALKQSPLYAEDLGIDLSKNKDEEIFKWFLASILYGKRISETIASHTYNAFARHGLLTPEKILDAGWNFLVHTVMREGKYIRYDESTSRKLLRICESLIQNYQGSLKKLHQKASDSRDLEKRLDDFYGIGPVTVNIFLRELRPWWEKSDPEPLPVIYKLARKLNIPIDQFDRKSMEFVRIEAGLIRHKKEILRGSGQKFHEQLINS